MRPHEVQQRPHPRQTVSNLLLQAHARHKALRTSALRKLAASARSARGMQRHDRGAGT